MKPTAWLAYLVRALSVLALSACSGFVSGPTDTAVEVVFDTPVEEIEGGVRLAPSVESWDGYGEAVDVYGDVLVIGAPEFNHFGPGSAYVYRLSGGEWQQEAQLAATDRGVYENQAEFGNSAYVFSLAPEAGGD